MTVWPLTLCWRYRELAPVEARNGALVFGGLLVCLVAFEAWEWLGIRATDRAIKRWEDTGIPPKGYEP